MPFRLYNTLATFQYFINKVIKGLINTELMTFLNNILIFGDIIE